MKNERKSLNLGGKIIINNFTMQMNLPLFEGINGKNYNLYLLNNFFNIIVHFEYIKPNIKRGTCVLGNYLNSGKYILLKTFL